MLKTKCSECNSWVYSPLLTELDVTVCTDCGATFAIKDLFVSTGPFSIYRDSLLKNIHKYTRLLKEAKSELNNFVNSPAGSTADPESIATLETFVAGLEELLSGCRESLRIPVEDSSVKYSTDKVPCDGKLVNISTTGICIEACDSIDGIKKNSFLILIIGDMTKKKTIYLHGKVVWTDRSKHIGVRFIANEPEVREKLRNYISDGSPLYRLPVNNA